MDSETQMHVDVTHTSKSRINDRISAAFYGTYAEIDLGRFRGNIEAIVNGMGSYFPVGLMAVLKANAYGHGLIQCGLAAVDAGAAWLGVARIEEAVKLRDAGVNIPILVLGPPNPALAPLAASRRVTLAVGSLETVDHVNEVLAADPHFSVPLQVHVKVDTGMHRYGVAPVDAVRLIEALTSYERLHVTGLFSHFSNADESDDSVLKEQVRRFDEVRAELRDADLEPPVIHFTNSASALRSVQIEPGSSGQTVVRAGLALYGQSPSSDVRLTEEFAPILTLRTRLRRVFTLQHGEGVSYGLTFVAGRPVRCGTVPVGYGDGLPRLLSNQGWMSVKGVRCPILGRVCMDQTVIDVSAVSEVAEGDEVIVYGDGSADDMTPEDIAEMCGTINYEIVTSLQARVPRLYTDHGQVIAFEDLLGTVDIR